MSVLTAAPFPLAGTDAPTVPVRALAIGVLGLFALDNLLLPAFLGAPIAPLALLAVPLTALFGWLLARAGKLEERVSLPALAFAFAAALAILVLGGEGRFLYATPDWQIRDAVLRDVGSNPWPFAYEIDGWKAVLRAPLGLYLVPALAKGWSDAALLLSNTVRLGMLLGLAGCLFDSSLARSIALAVFAAFSGWDVVGNALMHAFGGGVPWDHIEQWNPGSQYSSTLTLAFWVPNHAIAGWACALAYLAFLRGKAPVGLFAATIPLVALWSPLAALGALPFAVHAGIRALRTGRWNRYDLALAALAAAVAGPSLWYLQLGAGAVGLRWWPLQLVPLLLLVSLEIAPLAFPLLRFKRLRDGERTALWIAVYCLLFMPFVRIGLGIDFQMRASIVPLTVLALAFAEWLCDLVAERTAGRSAGMLALALGVLAVGAATPAFEIARALANPASPPPRCSLAGAWQAQTGSKPPYDTYLASASALPPWLAAAPVTAGRDDPPQCWSRPWKAINRP